MVKSANVEVRQGGFSDIRLWPCYMVFSGLVLFFTPRVGMFVSVVVVGAAFMLILKWVVDSQPMERYDVAAWSEAVMQAIKKDIVPPPLENYKVIEPKKPKIKVEKEIKKYLPRLRTASAKS